MLLGKFNVGPDRFSIRVIITYIMLILNSASSIKWRLVPKMVRDTK